MIGDEAAIVTVFADAESRVGSEIEMDAAVVAAFARGACGIAGAVGISFGDLS
jgi:hypothetical protein